MSGPLAISLKRTTDGGVVLTCRRADASVTWQRQQAARAAFFPRHDLTHYAVETVLGHRRGFYGLVAEGWDISDFGAPWPRGPMPADAEPAELIVGLLDQERAAGTRWRAHDFDAAVATYWAANGLAGTPPTITDEQLDRIRALMAELFARWERVQPGEEIALEFLPT